MKINKNLKIIVGSSMIIITIAGINFFKSNNTERKYKFYEINQYEVVPNTDLDIILELISNETCFDEYSDNQKLTEKMYTLEQLLEIEQEIYNLTKDTILVTEMPSLEQAKQTLIENTDIKTINSKNILNYYPDIKDYIELYQKSINKENSRNIRTKIIINEKIIPTIKAYIVVLRHDIAKNYAFNFKKYTDILKETMIIDKYNLGNIDLNQTSHTLLSTSSGENTEIFNYYQTNLFKELKYIKIDNFKDYEYFTYYLNDFLNYLTRYEQALKEENETECRKLETTITRKLTTSFEVMKEVLGRNYEEHLGFRHEYKDSIYKSYTLGEKKLK